MVYWLSKYNVEPKQASCDYVEDTGIPLIITMINCPELFQQHKTEIIHNNKDMQYDCQSGNFLPMTTVQE